MNNLINFNGKQQKDPENFLEWLKIEYGTELEWGWPEIEEAYYQFNPDHSPTPVIKKDLTVDKSKWCFCPAFRQTHSILDHKMP